LAKPGVSGPTRVHLAGTYHTSMFVNSYEHEGCGC
jgi:hypothetical protein